MVVTRITISHKDSPYITHVDSMLEYQSGWRYWADEPIKYVEYYDPFTDMDVRDELIYIDGEMYIGTIYTERQ